MKKLTAGIFATILGVTAMGAADAAVTSKGYVDSAVGAVAANVASTYATKQTVTDLSTTVQGAVSDINGLTTDVSNLQSADTTLQGNIDTLAGKVGTVPEGKNVIGIIDEKTAGIASSSTVTNLTNRVNTLETASATHALKTDVYTKTEADGKFLTEHQSLENYATKSYADTAAETAANGKDAAIKAAKDAADAAAAAANTNAGNITTLQGDLNTVSTTAGDAAANASAALGAAGTAQAAAEAAQTAANAAQQTANANTLAIEGLGSTYVTNTVYNEHVAGQEAINSQVETSLNSLDTNKADKTALNNLATKTELSAKADQSALNAEATTRENTDNALQAAINAIESGVGGIETAGNGADGLYALTKKVTTTAEGTTTTYVWELIDRDYAADDLTANGQ